VKPLQRIRRRELFLNELQLFVDIARIWATTPSRLIRLKRLEVSPHREPFARPAASAALCSFVIDVLFFVSAMQYHYARWKYACNSAANANSFAARRRRFCPIPIRLRSNGRTMSRTEHIAHVNSALRMKNSTSIIAILGREPNLLGTGDVFGYVERALLV
jgi:hypothetical protein